MGRATKGAVESHQNQVRDIEVKIDGTGTAAVLFGANHVTLTDNGTGDYTLTLVKPGQQTLFVSVTPLTKVYVQLASVSATAVQILTFSDAGSATDADFYALIRVSDSQYQY